MNGEIANLKALVEKLEHERSQSKSRIKELTDENVYLQKKSHEHQFGSEGEDSPDALSEIDRQQELHNNINMKNKHIKRLLRDIEVSNITLFYNFLQYSIYIFRHSKNKHQPKMMS